MSGAYRHELKYYLNRGDYLLLSDKLRKTMAPDAHAARTGGEYFIRSLYFDDPEDLAFREKLDGIDRRDKYRIRFYNMDSRFLKLERKHKESGYIYKESMNISREECEAILNRDYRFLAHRREPFAKHMLGQLAGCRLAPRVIVDYVREPYVFPVEDVRITFDKNIRTAYRNVDLFDPHLITYPAVEDYDMVMEVKYNRYLSTHIRSLLQTDAYVRSAISKYCLCRKFEL